MRMIANTTWPVETARKYIEDRVMIVPWSGCWLWEKGLRTDGYGAAYVPRSTVVTGVTKRGAHRLSHEAFTGPVPEHDSAHGMCVLHKCDVRACCNPEHMFLGTQRKNVEDMVAKLRARHPRGEAHYCAKLTEEDVRKIRARLSTRERQAAIASDFGVSEVTISAIKTGRVWGHVGAQ